jgi:hypothetical protein
VQGPCNGSEPPPGGVAEKSTDAIPFAITGSLSHGAGPLATYRKATFCVARGCRLLGESGGRAASMHACSTVSSDRRLLSLVSAFAREFAGAAGLPDPERARLVGALDEAVRFMCERA